MKPAAGVLPWYSAAPPFNPLDTAGRGRLTTRDVARRFIQLFYVDENPQDAFTCWMHPQYIQHKPRDLQQR